jgi:hypothetical protein
MKIPRLRMQYVQPIIFLYVLMPAIWTLSSGGAAGAGYADSAHGDSSIGVDRSGAGYAIGDCAQCHDTFDLAICGVNDLMLFGSENNQDLCFKCHDGTTNVQYSAFNNNSYSMTFGGGSVGFSNVKAAFNADASGGSSHNLTSLLNWAVTNHPEWGFTSASNPCSICHDSHLAKRNWFYPQDPTYTAIRRPSLHASDPANQWGDDTDERMSANWSAYQAPNYQGGNYEPGGTTSTDGSAHPDYASLCLDCHVEIDVGVRTGIDWENDTVKVPRYPNQWGPIHGEFARDFSPTLGYLNPPWSNTDYVLSCLDCHEPHGSSNKYMLRTTVNAVSSLTYDRNDNNSVRAWCEACHTIYSDDPESCSPGGQCHVGYPSPVHFNYSPYCIDCHNHAPAIICGLVHGTCP